MFPFQTPAEHVDQRLMEDTPLIPWDTLAMLPLFLWKLVFIQETSGCNATAETCGISLF